MICRLNHSELELVVNIRSHWSLPDSGPKTFKRKESVTAIVDMFIAKLSREVHMDDYVHEYFSVAKFKKAYSGVFNPMTSRQFWPRVDPGYKIKKPILRRKPGRPRKSRIKASYEPSSTKQKRCPECHELGHTAKKCQGGLTARQKRSRLSSDNALEEGSNDPSATLPSSSSSRHMGRGRGRATRS